LLSLDEIDKENDVKCQVVGTDHAYYVKNSGRNPSFVSMPKHEEIFYRLVLRASFTENLSDLGPKLSNC
jgi:hypothetical protein